MSNNARPAGGRATQAGMDFQASVGVWFSSHLVSSTPVGNRFGLGVGAFPVQLQFETGTGLDDLEIHLSDGSLILVQCKTRPGLAIGSNSAIASTLVQLASYVLARYQSSTAVDFSLTSAVLAVSNDAPISLNNLNAACRMFDTNGSWAQVYPLVNQEQRGALDIFRQHINDFWFAQSGHNVTEELLALMAKMFRIVRFDLSDAGYDLRESARVVGTRLYGDENAGFAPVEALQTIVRRLMRSGAPTDSLGMLNLLRNAGYEDTQSPLFNADIARLKSKTQDEVDRLIRHSRLSIGSGVVIPRRCLPALKDAVNSGSLLVIGEPGAGKTGVLVSLAQERLTAQLPTIFLSVDDLYGISHENDLIRALDLNSPIITVLKNWPGCQPGLIIIDALDASRGGPSEIVFSRLIANAIQAVGDRWSIVASIRTFDLRNGRRFRDAVRGTPPSGEYSEQGFDNVRHFKIPSLSDDEIEILRRICPELENLFNLAPIAFQSLLKNVFNLSIASELISGGTTTASFDNIVTQSELLEAYEDQRLPTSRLKLAVKTSVEVMVRRQRLTIKTVDVEHEALDDVLSSGVIVSSGDRIQFAHHVLFDHAAGRFYLDWDDTQSLKTQITSDPAIGLLLGPSLRFAMERVWREDSIGRLKTWELTLGITNSVGIDPVVASVALRTIAERVTKVEDVQGLCVLLANQSQAELVGPALSKISRFVSMSFADRTQIPTSTKIAWAEVAAQTANVGHRGYADSARFLLFTLSENGDFADPDFSSKFGQAARRLLNVAWEFSPPIPNLASISIRMVTKSFQSDVAASKALLNQIIQEPRFTEHAHEEAPWLAEGIKNIIDADPDFATQVYDILFERNAPSEGETLMGGNASRIMPLISNRRQDYEHARWQLTQQMSYFLSSQPKLGTVALNRAILGVSENRRSFVQRSNAKEVAFPDGTMILVMPDNLSWQEWRDVNSRHGSQAGSEILDDYVNFLRNCSYEELRTSVLALMEEVSAASLWARVFGVAAERTSVADGLLWPIACNKSILEISDIVRDAIIYLAEAYPRQSKLHKQVLHRLLIVNVSAPDADAARQWEYIAARFLSTVDYESLEPTLQELHSELEQRGSLTGNRPVMTLQVGWGGNEDITDSLLRDDGANLVEGPDAELRRVVRPLDDLMRDNEASNSIEGIARLWVLCQEILTKISELGEDRINETVVHSSLGSISNAISKICHSEHYQIGESGHPAIAELTQFLDVLAQSPYPRLSSEEDFSMMGWGNWDVRVYVAQCYIQLAAMNPTNALSLRDQLLNVLDDPVPTVRLQVAQNINTLWEVDREHMWRMADKVASDEQNKGVIGYFIGGPLLRLANADSDRCAQLVSSILQRLPHETDEQSRRGDHHDAIACIAAHFWIGKGRNDAHDWVRNWIENLVSSEAYLWEYVSRLREGLFARFQSDSTPEDTDIQTRARESLFDILAAANHEFELAQGILNNDSISQDERLIAEEQFKAAIKLISHGCNQLYFGSGAFKSAGNDDDLEELGNAAKMAEFLSEYEATLDQLASCGHSAVTYHLVELYEYLIPGAPELVFDKVSSLVVGSSARDGFHYESLALDCVVRIVRRYLADYRVLFDDSNERAKLVNVLELFSSVGWPDALKLLYELPDLLR